MKYQNLSDVRGVFHACQTQTEHFYSDSVGMMALASQGKKKKKEERSINSLNQMEL